MKKEEILSDREILIQLDSCLGSEFIVLEHINKFKVEINHLFNVVSMFNVIFEFFFNSEQSIVLFKIFQELFE